MTYKILPLIFQVLLVSVSSNLVWETPNNALDNSLYESVLDPALCNEQVNHVKNNVMLLARFLDSGLRTPRGILIGNTVDLGNYHQCLGINEKWEDTSIQGKYCRIRVRTSQSVQMFDLNELPEGLDFNPRLLKMDNRTLKDVKAFNTIHSGLRAMNGFRDKRLGPESLLSAMTFSLAVCIPAPCTTQQAITSLLFNVTELGFQYEDDNCRLPNDKPWVPADYTAVVVFSILGILTLLSTSYDIYHTLILSKDPKAISVYGRSFSVITNGKRLMNFTSSPGTVQCLDGVRALAMMWVILGHAFISEPHWANPIDTFQWTGSISALWITGAHITVDTFFMLSGLLVVYTTAGKLTGMALLKNLHLFYLNRLLRMFPILAAGILLEASYWNRATDGPDWSLTIGQVDRCRTFWWSSLLYIQNYLNPNMTCIGQTWYLAIDMQLHILSPLVLFWVLSGRKTAWIALSTVLIAHLAATTTYNFINNFPSAMMTPTRLSEFADYFNKYYVNTLTRASPFFVGMIVGYLMYLCRDEKIKISKVQALLLWICALSLTTFVIYTNYPILQMDWNNQLLDNLYNIFIRPIWATAVGIMIFLCNQGYGGPINWFLCLGVWKLIARVSYAMYIFHYSLMTAVNSTAVAPVYFTPGLITFKTLAHFTLCLVVSISLTLLIDSPFSTLFKLLLGKGSQKKQTQNDIPKDLRTKDEKQT